MRSLDANFLLRVIQRCPDHGLGLARRVFTDTPQTHAREGKAQPDSPSTRLQAVAGGGVPCDFRRFPKDIEMLSFWLGGTRRQQAEQYRLASPAEFVSSDDPPMFFFHGENDKLVPMDSPVAMCRSLSNAGVPAGMYVVPGVGHVFAMLDRTALEKCATFLAEKMQAGDEP